MLIIYCHIAASNAGGLAECQPVCDTTYSDGGIGKLMSVTIQKPYDTNTGVHRQHCTQDAPILSSFPFSIYFNLERIKDKDCLWWPNTDGLYTLLQ